MTTKPAAKGQASARLSPRWRRAALILAGLVALLLLLSVVASIVAAPAIRSMVASKAEQRGIPLRLGDISVRPWGDVVISDVCLSDPSTKPASDWVCVGSVSASPRWLSLLSGRPALKSLSLSHVVVSAGADHGSPKEQAERLKELLRSKKAKNPDAPSDGTKRALGELTIRLDDLVVDLANQNLPTDRIEVDSGRFSGTPEAFEARADVRFRLAMATIASLPVKVELPEAYEIRASRSLEEPGPRIIARGQNPIVVATDKLGGLSASFDGVGGVWPNTLIAEGGKVGRPGVDPLVSFDSGLLVLSELSRDLEKVYLTSARVDGLNLQVTRDEQGFGPLGALLGINPTAAASAPAAGAPAKPGRKDKTPALWAKRKWYEKLPQQVELPGLKLGYHDVRKDQNAPPIALEFDTLRYALRTEQIDLTVASRFTVDERSAGTANLTAAWNHSDNKLDLNLDAVDIAFGKLLSGVVGTDGGEQQGLVNVQVDYRSDDKGPGINFTGKASLRDLKLSHRRLRAPLEVAEVAYEWKALRGGADKKTLRWEKGDGNFNGIPFSLRLALGKFNLAKWPIADRIDLQVGVPETDAMRLFDAIPPSLRAELNGTKMAGSWGFDLDVSVGMKETDKGIRIAIEEPRTFDIHDDSLALISLPEPVDVRRLNRDFHFTFTGSEGSVTRDLYMRAPGAWMYGQPDTDAPDAPDLPGDEADTGGATNGWVKFENMNYYLVATQLYRENGTFFQKEGGINETELRRVIEEAINRRKLGRGASTISMQLVKNVFLSHERAVERKFQEIFLTYWLNRVVPKPRILEVYLNMIEWGKGINGLADAAKYYFNKTPHELTLAESVWISSISPAPLRRENQRATGVPPWFREVIAYTIRGMGKRGKLSEAEVARGLRERIRFANQTGDTGAVGDAAAPTEEELADALPEGEGEGAGVIEAEGSGEPRELTEEEKKLKEQLAKQAAFLAQPPDARLSAWGASARQPRGAGPRPPAASNRRK